MLYDYKTITNYLHFGQKPIRFGSVVTKKYGFSIQVLYINLHKPFKRSMEFRVHCVVRVSFLSKLGREEIMTCLTKILISS